MNDEQFKRHELTCPAAGNFQPPYEDCNCGADEWNEQRRVRIAAVQGRYFIGTDCSSHEYIVPLSKKAEWDAWTELDEDDERSWDAPDYATYLDGGLLTFAQWRIE